MTASGPDCRTNSTSGGGNVQMDKEGGAAVMGERGAEREGETEREREGERT